MINKNKLKAKMYENGKTNFLMAKELGISPVTFSYKLNNKSEFTATEIKLISEFLCLSSTNRDDIFFGINVDK